MMEGSGTLEQQLDATRKKAHQVREHRSELKKIEDLGQILEEHLILDNRYTEHRFVLFFCSNSVASRMIYFLVVTS